MASITRRKIKRRYRKIKRLRSTLRNSRTKKPVTRKRKIKKGGRHLPPPSSISLDGRPRVGPHAVLDEALHRLQQHGAPAPTLEESEEQTHQLLASAASAVTAQAQAVQVAAYAAQAAQAAYAAHAAEFNQEDDPELFALGLPVY